MPKRPPIPADLERSVLLEAGHRCAIHTCRQTPVELAHIVPWSRCREHTQDNLITLCPTCHARFDKGEIDRKSMLEYKARLLVDSGRLSHFELRLLRKLRVEGTVEVWLLRDLELLIEGLVETGYVEVVNRDQAPSRDARIIHDSYHLTDLGRAFAVRFR